MEDAFEQQTILESVQGLIASGGEADYIFLPLRYT